MEKYSDFLSWEENEKIVNILKLQRWGFGFTSTDKNKPIWNFDKEAGKPITEILMTKIPPHFQLIDYHINGQTQLLDASPHTDNFLGCTHTLVYFPNNWEYVWGGRLHIFDGDIPTIITPTWNSAVLFDSNLVHYAEAPSEKKLRVSISLKLIERLG